MKKAEFIKPTTLEAIHTLAEADAADLRRDALLQKGNGKTGTEGKYGAVRLTKGLPVHDCFWRTKVCEQVCYAIKFSTWGTLKQGMAGHYSRLAHQDCESLYAYLERDIRAALVYEPDGFLIRIHEAGDFVSFAHIQVYHRLAEQFPNVQFWSYSRAWVDPTMAIALQAINELPNVVIRESLDASRPEGTGLAPVAYFGPKELEPKGGFRCPEQLGGPKCSDCGLCWRVNKPVIFKQHQ